MFNSKVVLSSPSVSLISGNTRVFTAISNSSVKWSATGGTLTGSGKTVTYKAGAIAGTYRVTATNVSNGRYATAIVNIIAANVVTSVVLDHTTLNFTGGSTSSLIATVNYTGIINTGVTWKVDGIVDGNTTVGAIIGAGNSVTYKAPITSGIHTITATSVADDTKFATCSVIITVSNAVLSVVMDPTSLNLVKGASAPIAATVNYIGTESAVVTWTTDSGTITGVGNMVTYYKVRILKF